MKAKEGIEADIGPNSKCNFNFCFVPSPPKMTCACGTDIIQYVIKSLKIGLDELPKMQDTKRNRFLSET